MRSRPIPHEGVGGYRGVDPPEGYTWRVPDKPSATYNPPAKKRRTTTATKKAKKKS